ncbi:MAG TPA: hypothetical protein VJ022_00970 [Anaerolineales bacterium]|nr:hypothetical protein [Anaerolineales bacterium]
MNEEPPLDEKLSYQTRPMVFPDGASVEEFIIPDEDKELVLAQLYPFSPIPKLTDVMYDLHADKTFVVKDFRVTWEHGMNYLVSPYYPESGGTVIDWMDENSWVDDEPYDEESDDGSDDDLDTEGKEDDIPF